MLDLHRRSLTAADVTRTADELREYLSTRLHTFADVDEVDVDSAAFPMHFPLAMPSSARWYALWFDSRGSALAANTTQRKACGHITTNQEHV
jgi:hypothetical protein